MKGIIYSTESAAVTAAGNLYPLFPIVRVTKAITSEIHEWHAGHWRRLSRESRRLANGYVCIYQTKSGWRLHLEDTRKAA